jgi:hypothetical protein
MGGQGMAMRAWSVYISAVGDPTAQRLSDQQQENFAKFFVDARGSVSTVPGQYAAQFTVEADDPREALDTALSIFNRAVSWADLPHWQLVDVRIMEQDRLRAALIGPLVGVTEIAWLLKVSKQRVTQLAQRDDFPAPQASLKAGPVWQLAQIEEFKDRWSRRTGRPPKEEGQDDTDEEADTESGGASPARTENDGRSLTHVDHSTRA